MKLFLNFFHILNIGKFDCRKRTKRTNNNFVLWIKRDNNSIFILSIHHLKHADKVSRVIFHRDDQHGLGTETCHGVIAFWSRKVEFFTMIYVLNINYFSMNRCISTYIFFLKWNWRNICNWLPVYPSAYILRNGSHNTKLKHIIFV